MLKHTKASKVWNCLEIEKGRPSTIVIKINSITNVIAKIHTQ